MCDALWRIELLGAAAYADKSREPVRPLGAVS
jgi:hypothetical protein